MYSPTFKTDHALRNLLTKVKSAGEPNDTKGVIIIFCPM